MQLTELFRRGIVMPLNELSKVQLSSWNFGSICRVQFIPLNDDMNYLPIWDSQLFQKINEVCGTNIDDYEEECLTQNMIKDLLVLLNSFILETTNVTAKQFASELKNMAEDALKIGSDIYIIL